MATKSVVEKLWEVNPEAEIWWDSSPLIFDNWRSKMIQQASDKKQMTKWIDACTTIITNPRKTSSAGSPPILLFPTPP